MNLSYKWLRATAPGLTDSPERVAQRLAMYGAPVDDMVRLGGDLDDIVVARVKEVRSHPAADRLVVCDVEAAAGTVVQVVCGAPNVLAGRYYPFVPAGGTLPGGMHVRSVKLRGQESHGMLCSERELGLGRDHEGIMELTGAYDPGESFTEAVGLDDVRLVLDVTPNRPDLLSHVGVARELVGVAGIDLPAIPGVESADSAGAATAGPVRVSERYEGTVGGVRVRIEDAHGCPRYLAGVIRGVRIGPSPGWLAARLRAVGLRPINNVVDATNYVLYELGQPLHAFDIHRLSGDEVGIRRARAGEEMVTLDGTRRKLSQEMLVIADSAQPVAVAGVMGGENSEVLTETRDIFLECALFDPKMTRNAARSLGLSTDASYRFERGVDPDGMETAVRRAMDLICSVAGGVGEEQILDLTPDSLAGRVVEIRPGRVTRVLGVSFGPDDIAEQLQPLGFTLEDRGHQDSMAFKVPGHRRYDVEREEDLIEEVARRFGYDRFPDDMRPFRPTGMDDDPLAELESRLRSFLVGRGFYEARPTTFAPEADGDVPLLNPLSSAESHLRRALLPGLLRRLEHNFSKGTADVRLFEIGTVFSQGSDPGGPPREATHLAGVFTGARAPEHWSHDRAVYDLFDLKGLLGGLCAELGIATDEVLPVTGDSELETRWKLRLLSGSLFSISSGPGSELGVGGMVDLRFVDAPPWADAVMAFEVELVPELARERAVEFEPISQFPSVERDLSLTVPLSVTASDVQAVLEDSGAPLLESLHAFDLFQGAGIPEGCRSIAYRLRFRAPDRTLTDAEVDSTVTETLQILKEKLSVKPRE